MNDAANLWKPNVTVAAVVEWAGKFLLVEEESERGLLFNQPAGHLESGESLVAAVTRETLEETAYHFIPRALLGIYQYKSSPEVTYLRFAFIGEITGQNAHRRLDTGIVRAAWLSSDEVRASSAHHRTPLVMRSVDDYLAGKRFPLELITHYG